MSSQQPTGPCCQSCGMPLGKPEDFGTDATGHRVTDYCHFCFTNGAFVNPQMPMQAMIDKCVDVMAKRGIMPQAQARALMTDLIPTLKRWRATAGAVASAR